MVEKPILRSASTTTAYPIGNFDPRLSERVVAENEKDGVVEHAEKENCGDSCVDSSQSSSSPSSSHRALQPTMNLSGTSAAALNKTRIGKKVARYSNTKGREQFMPLPWEPMAFSCVGERFLLNMWSSRGRCLQRNGCACSVIMASR